MSAIVTGHLRVRGPAPAGTTPGARRPVRSRIAFAATTVLASLVATGMPASAAPPVGLGTAASFAVLAGAGITNTGPTTITGDVGTFPTTTESGFSSVTLIGTDHAGDAVTQGAKTDLVTAYDDAAGRLPATSVPVELGGSTLPAGVYTSGTFGLTGTLTLDAQGDPDAQFVFQAASTLITESASRVLLVNGADPCRVVWQVGSSATFKTGSIFVGDVLAQISITAQTTATFQGRLLARDGAVTLDTNTITSGACGPSAVVGPGATTPGVPGSPGLPDAEAVPPVSPDGPSIDLTTTTTLPNTGIPSTLAIAGVALVTAGAVLVAGGRAAPGRRHSGAVGDQS